MLQVPRFVDIDTVSEKHITEIRDDTGEKIIIPYKDWEKKEKQQTVYKIPIEYCKYRIDNGRIMTQVLSYETLNAPLKDVNDENTQSLISKFLGKSDTTQNENLKKILKKEGQKEPAVITADGMLINGNRRKWAFEQLNKANPSEEFRHLKVVILPCSKDPQRPTVSDLALLENRYQVYMTGKSEYTAMNKALKLLQNAKQGIPIEEMLKDDSTYSNLTEKEFKNKVKKFKESNIVPVELMAEYLKLNKSKDDFNRVAHKWASFQELSTRVVSKLEDQRTLAEHDIREQDIGLIKAAAFNIIKLRDHSQVESRNHMLIRNVFRWIDVDKKEFYKIGKIEDINEDIGDPDERYNKWNDENNDKIINSIKKLKGLAEKEKDQQDPLNRLEEALAKLTHEDLSYDQLSFMKKSDIPDALKTANSIQTTIKGLVSLLYYLDKGDEFQVKKLIEEFKSR